MLGGSLQKGIFKLFSNIHGKIDRDTRELIHTTEKAKLPDIDISESKPFRDIEPQYTVDFDLSQLIPNNEKGKLKGNRKTDILTHSQQDILENARVHDKSVPVELRFSGLSLEQKIQGKTLDALRKEQEMSAEELNKEKDRIALFRNFSISEILSKDPTKRLQEINNYIGETLEENGKALAMWVGSFKMILSVLPTISLATLKDNGEKIKNFGVNFFNYLKTAITTFRDDVWKPIWRQIIPMSRFEELGGVGQFLANILCGYNKINVKTDFEQAITNAQNVQVQTFNKENNTNYQSLTELKEDVLGDKLVARDGKPVHSNITYNRTVGNKLRSYENLAEYLQYEGFATKKYDGGGNTLGKVVKNKNGELTIANEYYQDAKGKTKTPKLTKTVKWNDLEFASQVPYLDLYRHIHNEIDLYELIKAIADSENDDKTIATVIRYILTQLRSEQVLPHDYPDLINDNVSVARINDMATKLYNLQNPKIIGGDDAVINNNVLSKSKIKKGSNINNLHVSDVKNFIQYIGTDVNKNVTSVNKASYDTKQDLSYLQKVINAKEDNKATVEQVVSGETSNEPKTPTSTEPVNITVPKTDVTNYSKNVGSAKNVAEQIVKEQEQFQNENPIEETTETQEIDVNSDIQVQSENGETKFGITVLSATNNGTKVLDNNIWDMKKNSQSNYENKNGL